MKLKDVAAIVTGGASGLGGAVATMIAARGGKVTIVDLAEEAGRLHAAAIGGRFIRADITCDDDIDAAFDAAEQAHGVARILVNCAGIATGMRTVGRDGQPHSMALFRKAIDVNLIGTFAMISRFAARLSATPLLGEERGVIVNTASVAGYDGQIGQAAYAASKAGVIGMTLPLARDLSQAAIRVMAIAPGIFRTPMVSGLPQGVQDSLGKQVPFPSRLGEPEEFAELVAAVLANPMLNGEVIRLDGAIRMPPK
ncbi:SDR family oxidoreductase [Sphingomonas sp. MG17]|uniref:SDR family oxidoreductase n=1 Tax=Sphingomonas tagetis TaxID=2949092 RepID=A0A9X2HRT2_9SPHN|nr:SDR family NAD(P)-dependent oxidoreductase [Sphingomonas tagetis]MCP3731420.1 SDR family oxidoreductase [Sphingomonas tagetis]